jgi:peptidylprolyl isomerase
LYLNLPAGRVVFELASEFAPRHIDNLITLVGQKYFDGLAIVRAQENYVVQWGDPAAATPNARSLGAAQQRLAGEYFRDAQGLAITQLISRDAYANEVGFAAGFPIGRDGPDRRAWLLHCYGAFGVGRDVAADSGNAAELYVVIGHSPRHLDRNVSLIGRVIDGIELLSTLDRGQGYLGFYATAAQRTPIISMRLAADVPEAQRSHIELLRTDSPSFRALIAASKHRGEDWFVDPADHIEVCNVPLPARSVEGNSEQK